MLHPLSTLAAGGLALALSAFPATAQEPAPAAPPAAEAPKPAPRPPRISVSVRMMAQDEITRLYDVGRLSDEANPERLERERLRADGAGAVVVGPTALFTGVRDSASAVNVIGPPHGFEFQARLDPVRRALLEADFPGMLADGLRSRAPAARYEGDPPEGLSVAVAFFGLRTRESQPSMLEAGDDFCFVATGYAFALVAGGAQPDQAFALGVARRSPGMAEPLCASFLDYSDRGAYRLRQVMQQSADNIADWLVANILGGR